MRDTKLFSGLRFLALAALVFVVAGGGMSSAFAQSTFLSFTSQPGDYIGGGQSLTFTPADSQFSSMVSSDFREIAVNIFPPGSFWFLHMAAPAGKQLTPGVYEGATRWPFQDLSVPGLDFSGDGRGCNMSFGRFEVLEAVYHPFGYIEKFHATFEQHCESTTAPALTGEVQIINPPPPPPLTIEFNINRQGTVKRTTGIATISGTVKCSLPANVQINGTLTQRLTRFALASGAFFKSVSCSTTPASWSADASPYGTPFGGGPAQVNATASTYDPNFNQPVTVQAAPLIQLNMSQK